jgi:hypothetical protein
MKTLNMKMRDVTDANIDDLVGLCTPSLEDRRHAATLKEGGSKKREWIRKALDRFGVCAKVAYLEEKTVGFVEFYQMQTFPLLPKRDRRTIMITCVFVPDKILQNRESARNWCRRWFKTWNIDDLKDSTKRRRRRLQLALGVVTQVFQNLFLASRNSGIGMVLLKTPLFLTRLGKAAYLCTGYKCPLEPNVF